MNNILKSFFLSFILIGVFSVFTNAAANPKAKKLVFKSSTICKTCKSTIEETLKSVEGVLVSLVNLSSKKVSIKYDPLKTDEAKIKAVILKAGYAFNETQPAAEDFAKLPTCCKKDVSCGH